MSPLPAQLSPGDDGCWSAGEVNTQYCTGASAASARCWPLLLATATVSATTLALEITFTRIFSIVFTYHYVFLVLAVALLGLGVGALLTTLTRSQQAQYLLKRILGFMLILVPLGLLMGLPFPVALRLLAPMAASIMPWVWGVNAMACVLSSVLAARLAVAWGLPAVHILGATLYLLAGGMAYGLLLQQRPLRVRPT